MIDAARLAELIPPLSALREAAVVASRDRKLRPPTAILRAKLSVAFRRQGRVFLRSLRGRWPVRESDRRPLLEQASAANTWNDAWMDAVVATLEMFVGALRDGVSEGLRLGARDAAADIGAAISFALDNPRALAYLHEHAFELTKNLNQTTDAALHRMLEKALDEGWSWTELSAAIAETFESISEWRAELIATCELGNAFEEGSIEYVRQLSAAGYRMEKSWLTVGDDRVEKHCRDNEAQGWIDVDATFPSGHDRPLAHPRCRCTLLYEEHEDEASTAAKAVAVAKAEAPAELQQARTIADLMAEIGKLGSFARRAQLDELRRAGLAEQGEAGRRAAALGDSLKAERERLSAEWEALNKRQSTRYGQDAGYAPDLAKPLEPLTYEQLQAQLEDVATKLDEMTAREGALWDEYNALVKKQYALFEEIAEVDKLTRREVLGVIKSEKAWEDLKLGLKNAKRPRGTAVKEAEALDWLREVVGTDWVDEFERHAFGGRAGMPTTYYDSKARRASYYHGGRMLHMRAGAPTSTIVHEMGHWLEDVLPEIAAAADDFLTRRIAGEAPERLRKLTGLRSYRTDEVAVKDRFMDAYIGKLYPGVEVRTMADGTRRSLRRSTEVFSMGLQLLFQDPLRVLREDPEFFRFIIATLRRLGGA